MTSRSAPCRQASSALPSQRSSTAAAPVTPLMLTEGSWAVSQALVGISCWNQ
jgi:hypothetical protein